MKKERCDVGWGGFLAIVLIAGSLIAASFMLLEPLVMSAGVVLRGLGVWS